MTNIELAQWYETEVKSNLWDLNLNEYLIITDLADEIVDKWKWTEHGFVQIKYKSVENKFTGKIKPRNFQQELLFDMLQDETSKIKLVTGGFGVGKDFCMLSDALSKVEKGKYDKIVWIRNAWGVKNSQDIGFLPGSAMEKLMPYAMVLSDIVGGQYGMEYLLSNNKLELQHLSTIRGRNYNNAILYCTEAENLTKEHVQIILSRIGENSCLYINGDYKQSDDKIFERNSGINVLKEKLKDNPLFGYVELEKTERSKVADLAKLLD
jgi:PhoH-like ATPase